MTKQVVAGVLTTSLLAIVAISLAHASLAVTVTARVPFAFTVGDISLPAGDYTFQEESNGAIKFQSSHLNECVYWTIPGTRAGKDMSVRLAFHRYDEQYFLSEVFNGSEVTGRKFRVSKLERDHIGAASRALAANSQIRDVVVFGSQ